MTTVSGGIPSRFETPEGFLYRNAVLTRSGSFGYLRSELGLEGDGEAKVLRSQESIAHPGTLKRLRGAPIVMGHPEQGVTQDNWKDLVVGHVAGDPTVVGNEVRGDVVLGSREAVEAYERGVRELSIGDYTLELETSPSSEYEFVSVGPLESNHLGLVPRGRAGSGVRIFDIKPPAKEQALTPEQLQQLSGSIRDAIAEGLKGQNPSGLGDAATIVDSVTNAVTTALKPLTDGMTKMLTDAEKAEQKRKAEKAVDEAVDAALAKQKAEFDLMLEARPLIDDEAWNDLDKSDAKAVIAAALGDLAPTGEVSLEYLRGAMAVAAKTRRDKGTGGTGLPAGIAPYSDAGITASDARNKAITEFAKLQDEAFSKAGGS